MGQIFTRSQTFNVASTINALDHTRTYDWSNVIAQSTDLPEAIIQASPIALTSDEAESIRLDLLLALARSRESHRNTGYIGFIIRNLCVLHGGIPRAHSACTHTVLERLQEKLNERHHTNEPAFTCQTAHRILMNEPINPMEITPLEFDLLYSWLALVDDQLERGLKHGLRTGASIYQHMRDARWAWFGAGHVDRDEHSRTRPHGVPFNVYNLRN